MVMHVLACPDEPPHADYFQTSLESFSRIVGRVMDILAAKPSVVFCMLGTNSTCDYDQALHSAGQETPRSIDGLR